MRKYYLFLLILLSFNFIHAEVILRDSTVLWKHHRYSVNADYGIASVTNDNNDIVTEHFNGKVIENELFRIVLIPEFGGRVLSYFYKPTGHEYLYQSACGTPYGMGEWNFYYNWLMVYGGIFPTFPEPEHGKMWLKPWQYSVVKNTNDSVIVKMSITDNTEYSGRPGQFNNGITGIICDLEVGVYSGEAGFSFNVNLKNPSGQTKKYEYWTCTTLAPGSNIDNTFTPVNSEIVAPMTKYEAAWSPNNWIGQYGGTFDFSRVNMLSEWTDMGIGYGLNRTDDYWGVINHVNEEGFFRIADRNVTRGLKLWTWGKNASSANVYQISNGGKDDYIELWGGAGLHFFDDNDLRANSTLNSNEYFFPTVGLSEISKMNENGGFFFDLQAASSLNNFNFDFKSFLNKIDQNITLDVFVDDQTESIFSESFVAAGLGNTIQSTITSDRLVNGINNIKVVLKDENSQVLLSAQKEFTFMNTGDFNPASDNVRISNLDNHEIMFDGEKSGELFIYTYDGKIVYSGLLTNGLIVKMNNSGIFVVKMIVDNHLVTQKIAVK